MGQDQPPLDPRVAVVTGASSGIGEATARLLAERHQTRLVLVARRADRLERLAAELPGASYVAVDLTDADAPQRVRDHLTQHHEGRLDLLINNAGGAWRARFGDPDGGYENVRRTMAVNFDAVVRLMEALLPLLRASAPSAIVNVSSTAGRVARPGVGAYSASKFALAGWSDALYAEEKRHNVHVGLVLPGFIATEGFPQRQLIERPHTRWLVSTPQKGAEAILDAALSRKPERYVPRAYGLAAAARTTLPRLVRKATGG